MIVEEDQVMREIHRIKDEIAAEYDYDVKKLGKALKEQQDKSGRKVVSPPPRRVKV